MMPGAVTVQDSDVITTGPTHSIGGAGARQGRGVGGRGAQQTEGRGGWGRGQRATFGVMGFRYFWRHLFFLLK